MRAPFEGRRAHNGEVTADADPHDAFRHLGRELELRRTAPPPASDDPDGVFERAAVLRDNAMGIIYDGDGASDEERVGRLLALIPALLSVVDEARDTIGRLRELSGEQDPAKAISPYDERGREAPHPPHWDSSRGE